MELSKQVCSLPLSQRLQKLGVPQTAYFIWWWNGRDWLLNTSTAAVVNSAFGPDVESYSAYTVSELGILLPMFLNNKNVEGLAHRLFTSWNDTEGWSCAYCMPSGAGDYALHCAENEAEARGEMLATLLEQGLITSSSLVV